MRLTISMPDDIYSSIKEQAKRNRRTISNEIIYTLINQPPTQPHIPSNLNNVASDKPLVLRNPEPVHTAALLLRTTDEDYEDVMINIFPHNVYPKTLTYSLPAQSYTRWENLDIFIQSVLASHPEYNAVISNNETDILNIVFNITGDIIRTFSYMNNVADDEKSMLSELDPTNRTLYLALKQDARRTNRTFYDETDHILKLYEIINNK